MLTNEQLRTLDIVQLFSGLKAATTVDAYRTHWAKYVQFAEDAALGDANTLLAWRQHMIHHTQDAQATINLRLSAVKSVFTELAARKLASKETAWAINDVAPLKGNMLIERRRPHARVRIEPTDMRGLINTPEIRLGDPLGARDRALLLLLATSGLRVSEAIRVKVADLQQRAGHYYISSIMGKGASEARIAPLSKEAYEAVLDWLHVRPTRSEWVFTNVTWDIDGNVLYAEEPITRSTAYHAVKRVAAAYGMPEIKPHDLRRFVGTQLAQSDIRAAQRVLGHKSIETTAKHYVMDDVPLGSTEGLF